MTTPQSSTCTYVRTYYTHVYCMREEKGSTVRRTRCWVPAHTQSRTRKVAPGVG